MFNLLTDNVSGFFSFLNPIINLLEELDHIGLAIYSFFEVLLIIPPIEVIYYPLVQLNVETWYLYLLNVVICNVIASALGYFIGMKIGYPILRFFASEETLDKAQNLFNRYGVLAVGLGAFTPVPYTIVVFLAGISRMDFKKFMLSGFLGRVPRYVIGGYALAYIVQSVNSAKLNEYMLIMSIVGMLLIIMYYIVQTIFNIYKKRNAN
jgi:membrane protein YqaA with SNARE-associated domain